MEELLEELDKLEREFLGREPPKRWPNREMNWYALLDLSRYYFRTHGNAFILKVRNSLGEITEVYVIDPVNIAVVLEPHSIKVSRYVSCREDGTSYRVEDIIHARQT
jgi:phage portal protein BeeE